MREDWVQKKFDLFPAYDIFWMKIHLLEFRSTNFVFCSTVDLGETSNNPNSPTAKEFLM